MYETRIPTDLRTIRGRAVPPPSTLHEIHRSVAALMARGPDDARDYLYRYDRGVLRIRTETPRDWIDGWAPVREFPVGARIVLHASIRLDPSSRGSDQRSIAAPKNWRDPGPLNDRLRRMLASVMRIDDLVVDVGMTMDIGKPGHRVLATPIDVFAVGDVTDAEALRALVRNGLGRGKAYGFGMADVKEVRS